MKVSLPLAIMTRQFVLASPEGAGLSVCEAPQRIPMNTTPDDCSEILSLLRGASGTRIMGMTESELAALTRMDPNKIQRCLQSLMEEKKIVPMGTRDGEDVYGLNTEK